MFLFFGTRVTRKTLSEGEFHCPNCNRTTAYRERRDKEWGHLYFIPLIPMGEFAPYVQCRECKTKFEPDVLAFDPAAEQRFAQGLEQACLRSAVSLALMGTETGDVARELIVQLLKTTSSGTEPLDRSAVDKAFEEEQANPSNVPGMIKALRLELNEAGRETVMMNLVEIALVNGHRPTQDQIESIRRCGEWIGLSPMHVKGIIAELNERAP